VQDVFVSRPELEQLLTMWRERSSGLVFLRGFAGAGKSTILRAFSNAVSSGVRDPRQIRYVDAFDPLPPAREVAAEFVQTNASCLLIVDEIDAREPRSVNRFLQEFEDTGVAAMVVLAGRFDPSYVSWSDEVSRAVSDRDFTVLDLAGMQRSAMRDLLSIKATGLSDPDRARLMDASGGSPLMLTLLSQLTNGESVDDVLSRLRPETYEPNDVPPPREVEIHLRAVDDALIRHLALAPEDLMRLQPRKFEELMAELYSREGFEVSLTQQTRDGGIDLFLVRHTPFGQLLTIVDTKRYRKDRPVGVAVVRQLYGVVEAMKASAGVVATTSYFSQDARSLQETIPFRLALQDYFDLQTMLRRAASL
jgi:restriction system protein